MSVKAMALVWDMPCPSEINGMPYKPGHKYVLLAYADHADHHGKNIWPAVPTIATKTGYVDRSVQRLTDELEEMGVLVADGMGPRGTNKWYIPFSPGGDKISPVTKSRGDNRDIPLGDIPSGDIPSGDILSPDLKEPEPDQLINLYNNTDSVWGDIKARLKEQLKKAPYTTWVEPTLADRYDGNTLYIVAANSYARDWLDQNIKATAQEFVGAYVKFIVAEAEGESA